MEDKLLMLNCPFWYGQTNLSMFKEQPFRIDRGMILLCIKGNAVISTGIQQIDIIENSTSLFLPGMTFFLESSSEDFSVRTFTFSQELYNEIVISLPPSFSQYMHEIPAYKHPADSSTLKNVRIFMDMASLVHEERNSSCATVLQRNLLQSYTLYVLECVSPFLSQSSKQYTRSEKIFHQFISLVYLHCRQHHHITFYADQLSITPRYLYNITFECSPGLSPKQLIDKQLMLEIKAFLYSSDLSLTEIAYQLNFPDQSYLCRYFKRHTGISPTIYRSKIISELNLSSDPR